MGKVDVFFDDLELGPIWLGKIRVSYRLIGVSAAESIPTATLAMW